VPVVIPQNFASLSGSIFNYSDRSGLDFGDVRGGERSATLSVPVLSRTLGFDVPLTVVDVSLSNDAGGAFQVPAETCTASPIGDGNYCVIRVRFTPNVWQRGEITGSLTVMDDSAEVSHQLALTGSAQAPPAFVVREFGLAHAGSGNRFSWQTSDASKVTLSIVQPVTKVITTKKGSKVTKKKVTQKLPVTVLAAKSYAAGPGSFTWNGKINNKVAVKGVWTATITAVSARGKATLKRQVLVGPGCSRSRTPSAC
jgi:hypothetical protein